MSTEDDVKLVNTEETVSAESDLLKSIKENPSRTEDALLKLRHENQTRRETEIKLEGQLKAIQDEKELAKTKELEEQGKYQELLEEQSNKNKDLLSQLDILKEVENKYIGIETKNSEILIKELEGLDKDVVELIESSNMETIDKIAKARHFKELAGNSPKQNPATGRSGGAITDTPNLTTLGREKGNVSFLRV